MTQYTAHAYHSVRVSEASVRWVESVEGLMGYSWRVGGICLVNAVLQVGCRAASVRKGELGELGQHNLKCWYTYMHQQVMLHTTAITVCTCVMQYSTDRTPQWFYNSKYTVASKVCKPNRGTVHSVLQYTTNNQIKLGNSGEEYWQYGPESTWSAIVAVCCYYPYKLGFCQHYLASQSACEGNDPMYCWKSSGPLDRPVLAHNTQIAGLSTIQLVFSEYIQCKNMGKYAWFDIFSCKLNQPVIWYEISHFSISKLEFWTL